jgi:hypothetical protein
MSTARLEHDPRPAIFGPREPAAGRVRAFRAWTLTAALGLVYVLTAPPSSDLAAASYRSALFSSQGFTLWDNSWYAGHHLPAYSLLSPALGALLGPQLLAAISMTVAAWLFGVLVAGRYPARAVTVASLWFAWGAAVSLLSSRVPFDLGLAIGMGALVAEQRGMRALALVLTPLCAVASPVAGAFLALAFLAWAIAGPGRPRRGALAALALLPPALLAIAFPEGGTQPFDPSAALPALAGVLAVGALVPREQRVLRIGAGLYALALLGAYVLHTPVGGNAERLGALVAGPVAALVAASSPWRSPRMLALLLLTAPLLYWQANAPVSDFAAAASDPGASSSYYRPLLGELRALGVGYGARPARIEVVPLTDHWEARWLAPAVMLARGWERQLDTSRDALFYGSTPLTAAHYGAWLNQQAVSFVALPDTGLDYSAKSEARLLRGQAVAGGAPATGAPPPYLREIWRSPHWRLFAVAAPTPLVQPPATLAAVGHDSFALDAPGPGAYTVRLRFTPYWAPIAGHGCVERAPGDWTRVRASAAGSVRVGIRFALTRIFERDPRCA